MTDAVTDHPYAEPFRPLATLLGVACRALDEGGHRDTSRLDRAAEALEAAATLTRALRPALPPEARGLRAELRAAARTIDANRRPGRDIEAFDRFVADHLEAPPLDRLDDVRGSLVARRNRAGFHVVGATTVSSVRGLHARVASWSGPIDVDTVERLTTTAYRRARRARTRAARNPGAANLRQLECRLRRASAAMTYVADETLDRALGTRAASLDRVADRLTEHRRLGRLWRLVAAADTDAEVRLTILDTITIHRAELLDEAFVLGEVALAARPARLLAPRI